MRRLTNVILLAMTLVVLTAVATAVVIFLVSYRLLDKLTKGDTERFAGHSI